MPHNNAILLLENLTADERKAFQEYAAYRKYGNRKGLEKLLPAMCKYLNDIEKEEKKIKAEDETTNDFLKREKAKKKIKAENETTNDFLKQKAFNDKNFDTTTFNVYISTLSNLLKEYFVVQRVINDELLKQRFLLEDLRKRNLIDFIEKKDNKITKVASENIAESTDLYTIRWQIEDHTDRYHEVLIYKKEEAKHNITDTAAALDAVFLVNKMRYMCIVQNHNTVSTSEKITLRHTDFVLQWIADCPDYLEAYPLLKAYYLLLQMLQKPEDKTVFNTAHHFITQNEIRYDVLELDTIYSLLSNHAIAFTNAGEKEFAEIAMNLNKNGLEKNYFHRGNATIVKNYMNVVRLSIQCGKTDEIHSWLDALKKHEHKISKDAHTHCLACLDFHHKKYKDVIESIKNLGFTDELDKLANHALLLRAYFCAEETPDFEQFTGSKYYTGFTEYIPKIRAALQSAKEKISDDHYQQYNNFLEILL